MHNRTHDSGHNVYTLISKSICQKNKRYCNLALRICLRT